METPIPQAPIHQVAVNQDEEAPLLQRERHENSENMAQAYCILLAVMLCFVFLILLYMKLCGFCFSCVFTGENGY